MLARYRLYTQDRPLQGWLIQAACWIVFDLVLFAAAVRLGIFSPANPTPFVALLAGVLPLPTFMLIWRLSEEGRQETPIRPGQECGAGVLSLGLLLLSVITWVVAAAALCLSWPRPVLGWAGMVAIIAGALSGALGYAVRGTAAGRWGLRLACVWFALMFCTAIIPAIVGRHALPGHS